MHPCNFINSSTIRLFIRAPTAKYRRLGELECESTRSNFSDCHPDSTRNFLTRRPSRTGESCESKYANKGRILLSAYYAVHDVALWRQPDPNLPTDTRLTRKRVRLGHHRLGLLIRLAIRRKTPRYSIDSLRVGGLLFIEAINYQQKLQITVNISNRCEKQ